MVCGVKLFHRNHLFLHSLFRFRFNALPLFVCRHGKTAFAARVAANFGGKNFFKKIFPYSVFGVKCPFLHEPSLL